MTGEGCRFRRDPLHEISVADDPVCEMIDDLEARTVVTGSQMRFGHRQTHTVTEALTERSRGRLDAWCNATLRVARRHATPFSKLFDLFERKIITGKVKQTIKQHRAVPRREHEAITVEPFGIGRIVFEESGPQHICHRRSACLLYT